YSDEDDDGVGTPRPDSRIREPPPVLPQIDAGGDIELTRDVSKRSKRAGSKRSVGSTPPTVPRKSSRRQRRPPPIATGAATSPRGLTRNPSQSADPQGAQAYDPPVHMNSGSFQRLPFTSTSTPSP